MAKDYSDRYKSLLSKLKEARDMANLNQEDVILLWNKSHPKKVHQSFLSKIESGERRITFTELEDFARIYKLPITFFETKPEDFK